MPSGRTGYDALVEHCRIVGNQGGGMAISGGRNQDASFVVRDTEIADNVSVRFGGGLCVFRSLRAVDGTWDGNVAKTRGGGVYGEFDSAEVVIENGFFSKNVSQGQGGGFYADSGCDLELHDAVFVGNQAPVGQAGFVNTDAAVLLHCCEYPEEGVAVGKEPVTLVIDDSDCSVPVENSALGDVKDLFR